MIVQVEINNSTVPAAQFLSWTPAPCRIRMTNSTGSTGPTASVKLSSASAAGGGAVVFRAGTSGAFANAHADRADQRGVGAVLRRREILSPSKNAGDVTIEARVGTALVGNVR